MGILVGSTKDLNPASLIFSSFMKILIAYLFTRLAGAVNQIHYIKRLANARFLCWVQWALASGLRAPLYALLPIHIS